MLNRKIELATLFLFVFISANIYAQQAIPATGGDASGSGGSVSYTVGQVVYTTLTETNGSVVSGVQQPYGISIVSSIKEAQGVSLSVSAYPNPTTDYITLKIEDYIIEDVRYHIYDMQGKLLESKVISADQNSIDMAQFAPSTYLLKVFHNNREIKTFRIIKR